MAVFTLTAGVDNFTGNAGETNTFQFTASTLQSTDTITGGATGSFIDILSLTAAGTIAASQFAGVTNIEQLNLADGTNSVALTNGLVANSSVPSGFFLVIGGNGADTVDGSGITNNRALLLLGAGGADHLTGGNGNDSIDGGTGGDTMAGGAGNDIYYVDSTSDVVIENANEGNDIIYAT